MITIRLSEYGREILGGDFVLELADEPGRGRCDHVCDARGPAEGGAITVVCEKCGGRFRLTPRMDGDEAFEAMSEGRSSWKVDRLGETDAEGGAKLEAWYGGAPSQRRDGADGSYPTLAWVTTKREDGPDEAEFRLSSLRYWDDDRKKWVEV